MGDDTDVEVTVSLTGSWTPLTEPVRGSVADPEVLEDSPCLCVPSGF